MDILLVRHAAAQEKSEATQDMARPLTQEGWECFDARLLGLCRHLPPKGQVFIWTSPAARAMETARIIARECKTTSISAFPWIYSGDTAAFLRALSREGKDGTYIVVGHEPHLGNWSDAIHGIRLFFKKGGMAAFRVVEKAGPKAKLLWTCHAKPAEGASSILKEETLASGDYKYVLIFLTHTILFGFQKFLRQPTKPCIAHKLRVQTRKARSLISFIKPLIISKDYHDIQEQLKHLALGFSRLRELDVLLARCLEHLPQGSSLCHLIGNSREEELKRVYDKAQASTIPDTLQALLGRFSAWDEQTPEEEASFAVYAAKRARKWRKAASKAMENLDFNGFKSIHTLRIRHKKLRYVEHFFPSSAYGRDAEDKKMAGLQEDLGLICDTFVNIALLEELSGACGSAELLLEAESFRNNILNNRRKLREKYEADKAQ